MTPEKEDRLYGLIDEAVEDAVYWRDLADLFERFWLELARERLKLELETRYGTLDYAVGLVPDCEPPV
jgi:hypothetical protein